MTTTPVGYVITGEDGQFEPDYAFWSNSEGWVEWLENATVFSLQERDTVNLPVAHNVQWEPVYVHGDEGGDVLTTEPCEPRTCQDCRDANPLTGPEMVTG